MVDSTGPDHESVQLFEPGKPAHGAGGSALRNPGGVVRRNALLIIGCTAVLVGATAYFTSRMIPVYQAATSIRIDEKQSQLPALDILRLTSGTELDTEMEMLRSRSLAEEVADSLHYQVQLVAPVGETRDAMFASIEVSRDATGGQYQLNRQADGRFRVFDAVTDSMLGDVGAGGKLSLGGAQVQLAPAASQYESVQFLVLPFEDAVAMLEGLLVVSRPSREASLVQVSVEGTDAPLVRDVANLLTTRFIEGRRNVLQSETRSTVTFLREQLVKLSEQLRGAEDTLRVFREREQIVSLKDEASTGVTQLADVRAQRNAIEAERAALTQFLADARSPSAARRPDGSSPYRDLAAFPTLLRNSATVNLLGTLSATEASRAELLPNATPRDPDLQTLDRRRRELEAQLEAICTTYLRGLGNQVAALDSTIATSERRLDQVPRRELRYARLDRDAKSLEEIVTMLQSRLKEAEIAQAVSDPSVRLVDPALLPSYPIRPNLSLNLALAGVAGLMLGLMAAFLREYQDKSVHTRRDVLFATGAPVLGLIPHTRHLGRWSRRSRTRTAPRQIPAPASARRTQVARRHASRATDVDRLLLPGTDRQAPLAEANNSLATNLAFARPDSQLQLLVVTSPSPGDGKTTTAINLAITLAERGRKTLLIDADLRRGMVSMMLGLERAPGLSTALLTEVDYRGLVQRVDLEAGAHLDVLTTGALPENPAILLASPRALGLLQALRDEYDVIVMDTPPVNAAGDAAMLGTSCDGVLIVARAGVTNSQALAFTMEQLHAVHAPVLGGILNDIDFARDITYDGTYRYTGYGAPYTKEHSEVAR
jgi:polysaccharide biosynthesis transport protein